MGLKEQIKSCKLLMKNAYSQYKKGQISFGSLSGIALTMTITVLIIVVGSILTQTIRDDPNIVTANGTAFNISNQGLTFFDNLSSQFGLLGTIIILVLVITVIVGAFAFGRQGGRGQRGL